ncbi:MAG: hypothetical protein QNJ33_19935 [Crocosphaera sp.]|nr:hypothetical protein [Crocosphaera sp.]
MSQVTYQSKLPDKVAPFCEAMGQLFSNLRCQVLSGILGTVTVRSIVKFTFFRRWLSQFPKVWLHIWVGVNGR